VVEIAAAGRRDSQLCLSSIHLLLFCSVREKEAH
jgi:hypothetical protein